MSNGTPHAHAITPDQRPWSSLSIAAFVMSFTLILSPLAFIFGVAGILRTSGGRRKGLPLAITALPVSILFSVFLVLILLALVFFWNIAFVTKNVESVLRAEIDASTVAAFRQIATEELNAAVSDEEIQAWFARVRDEQGKLTSKLSMPKEPNVDEELGIMNFEYNARFVNGDGIIELSFTPSGLFKKGSVSAIEIGDARLP